MMWKKKVLILHSVINKLNTYMPLVLLPVYSMIIFKNQYIIAAIMIVIWRMITYFDSAWIARGLNGKFTKYLIVIILIIVNLSTIYWEKKLIINLLSYLIVAQYFKTEKTELKSCTNSVLYIVGMLICCAMTAQILSFYFIICIGYYLFYGHIETKEQTKRVKKEKKSSFHVIVFLHNFHYYIFAFSIPILARNIVGKNIVAGLFCASSWILFLLKNKVVSIMSKYITYDYIMSIGWIVTAMLLLIIGVNKKIEIIFLALLLQGLSGGISECFFGMKEFQKNANEYWNYWKKGGILAGVLGGVIAQLIGLQYTFIIAAVVAVVGCVYILINRIGKEY